MKNKLANLEKDLEYTFKDKNLLIKALTHTSSSQENNEVLEFLGDSVLNLIVTELLLEKFPNENAGFLSLMRSKLVSRKILNKIANDFKGLILNGDPIDEPIVAHGPFVMNTKAEILEAIQDYNNGTFAKY